MDQEDKRRRGEARHNQLHTALYNLSSALYIEGAEGLYRSDSTLKNIDTAIIELTKMRTSITDEKENKKDGSI